jgi:cytochrome c-type biogenesis protein CcmH/NrfF
MNCWSCDAELIWGGDHDTSAEDQEAEEHSIVTNLHCPKCQSFVLVYHGKE